MKNAVKSARVIVPALMLVGAVSVQAYEAGDVVLRAGYTSVSPNDDSSKLTINGDEIDAYVQVGDDAQLGLTVSYMVSSHWAVELLAATPFTHDISSRELGVKVGEVSHLPPTLSALWYPLSAQSAWQPYLGLGVNYTHFFSESVDGELEGVIGPASMELDDSWGLAAQVGVDYMLNDDWLLNASVRYIDLSTEAVIQSDTVTVETDVDIDPYVYTLSVGYKF